jgi:hypothetical protein
MNCPKCGAGKLLTAETFQTDLSTMRTKKCRGCGLLFKSREEIAQDVEITTEMRNSKRKSDTHEKGKIRPRRKTIFSRVSSIFSLGA